MGRDRAEGEPPPAPRRRRHRRPGRVVTGPTSVWVDGKLVDAAEARVSPFDHGLLVGDGVFETIRVYGGQPFAWTRHLDRLAHSASGLGLAVPDRDELRMAADAVLAANAYEEARLRITVTGGVAPLGSERGDAGPTVIVASSPVRPWPASVDVVVVPWVRNDRGATAGLKTTSYAENVRALAYARRARRERSDVRQHARRAVRGHRLQRVRGARRRGGHAAGFVGLPARGDARAGAGARPRAGHRDPRDRDTGRRAARRRRGVPHVDDAARCSRSPRSTSGRCRRCPARSPRPSPPRSPPSSPATSTPDRPWWRHVLRQSAMTNRCSCCSRVAAVDLFWIPLGAGAHAARVSGEHL